MTHTAQFRVYFEDTDLAGIVYYANYLKFIERGRSEWVRARGVDQAALKASQSLIFAVRRVEADYLRPARFDDLLDVRTDLVTMGGARIDLKQDIARQGEVIFTALVTLVCMSETGHAARIPEAVRAALNASLH